MREEQFGFPYATYPTGWFQIGWSWEIEPGTVKPLHYFGQELVMFRTASGKLGVLDAYCAHMGAHMAYGSPRSTRATGSVVGECIECPWHGWLWDTEGRNQSIPYSSRPNRAQRVDPWPVRELHGSLIMMWHDELGREPFWEPPGVPEFEDPTFYPLRPHGALKKWTDVTVKPQYLLENAADIAHVQFVHGAESVGTNPSFVAEGPIGKARFEILYGTKRDAQGDRGATPGYITADIWGVGVVINRLHGLRDNVMFIGTTPIDHDRSDVYCSNIVARTDDSPDGPDQFGRRIIENQLGEVESDMPIWANQRYIHHAAFTPEESPVFMALRRHCRQFYPDGSTADALEATSA